MNRCFPTQIFPDPHEYVSRRVHSPKATIWHAYFLGLVMKLGGCTISWNYAVQIGIYEFLITVIVIGVAYAMLGHCMAEIISIMTFSGGYYGYVRCAIGPFAGFLVGCSGALESIFYLGMYILKIGQFFLIQFDLPEENQPIIWCLTYIILIGLHICIAKYFWNVMFYLGLFLLILILIYLFGSMPSLNFEVYALPPTSTGFSEDSHLFFLIFRASVLFYLGFDMLTLTSNEIKDSKQVVPKVILWLIVSLIVLAVWLTITVTSQAPGISYELCSFTTYFPLVFGYQKIFSMSYKQAMILAALPSFGTAFAYLHIVGKQVHSMATSGLLPSIFYLTVGPEETPVMAMILVALVAFAGNYFAYKNDIYITTSRIATIAGCFVYLSMFYCFYIFRRRYSYLERSFRNPLGLLSAFIGSLIFLGLLIILLYFDQDANYPITILYFSYIGFMVGYYYLYVETHQCFSVVEQKVFFKIYIINMQRRKKVTIYKRFFHDFCSLCFGAQIFSQGSSSRSNSTQNNTSHLPRHASATLPADDASDLNHDMMNSPVSRDDLLSSNESLSVIHFHHLEQEIYSHNNNEEDDEDNTSQLMRYHKQGDPMMLSSEEDHDLVSLPSYD